MIDSLGALFKRGGGAAGIAASTVLALLLSGCAGRPPATAEKPETKHEAAAADAEARLSCPAVPASTPENRPQLLLDGLANYDAARYAEALRNFEALDADGSADGMALYRLAFCYQASGDSDKARSTYERSRDALKQRAAAGAASVEERFYLVNVLLNLDQAAEAKETARDAVAAIESCAAPVPPGGLGSFRVGKLYGDAGDRARQAAWYRRALKEFESDPSAPAAYVQRANAAVAAWEVGRSGWKDSIPHLQKMRESSPSDPDLLIALIVAQLHAGEVAAAEKSITELGPIAGQRRDELPYLKGLARTAKRMARSGTPLPEKEPDGTDYGDIPTDTLVGVERDVDGTIQPREGLLQKLAFEGHTLLSGPAEEGAGVIEKRGPKQVPFLVPAPDTLRRLDAVQGRFVSVCLEVLRRGLPLQEIGFTSSISPLVVHDWRTTWIQQHRPKGATGGGEEENAAAPAGAS